MSAWVFDISSSKFKPRVGIPGSYGSSVFNVSVHP